MTLAVVGFLLPFDPLLLLEQAGIPGLGDGKLDLDGIGRLFYELGNMKSVLNKMDIVPGVPDFFVGEDMHAQGYEAKYPVAIIPGIISTGAWHAHFVALELTCLLTGLESWSTSPDYRPYFRQKIWGGACA